MELTKTLVCCALVFIVMTDVVLTRPARSKRTTDMEVLIKDIDERLIASEKRSSRRRKRHIQTQQLALMDFCVRHPHRCRHEIQRLRSKQTPIRFVFVVDK